MSIIKISLKFNSTIADITYEIARIHKSLLHGKTLNKIDSQKAEGVAEIPPRGGKYIMSKLTNCKSCQKEIAKGVKKCVNCGADQRNFAGRHKILTTLAVLVVLGVISSASSGGSSNTTAPVASSANTTPVAAKPTVPVLSKEGVSSDVKISVKSFTSATSVGDVKPQGIFKLVKINVANEQKDAITVTNGSFKLIDDKGREFSSSSSVDNELIFSDKNPIKRFPSDDVNPGMSAEGTVVFDVPKDATGFTLQATGGIMGDKITLKVE